MTGIVHASQVAYSGSRPASPTCIRYDRPPAAAPRIHMAGTVAAEHLCLAHRERKP
ncbi:hypothetical protein REJC140_02999 [Pseudorhizobium endolithicum]|uniref:Uncharacterized protein n=1 Tax=Pseudorhizobium endolithicum TaxID=1191678 RepID=A0ABM8PIH5_9HYPH|nr:hypothetical protein REQ54_01696 [Rhizobium sp. Q54]CAD7032062.1 hypothetical protein REJC140_02999 [Pseudorhizobium endolithicum]